MATFKLVGAHVKRVPHIGLVSTGYYKQDPENLLERPVSITVFNRWPTVELDGELVEVPLNGVYEYPRGFSPAEQVAKKQNCLKKVVD